MVEVVVTAKMIENKLSNTNACVCFWSLSKFLNQAEFLQNQIIAIAVITRLPFALKKVNVDNLRSLISQNSQTKGIK
jgi:transcriptional regulatory protein LevR